MILCKKLKNSEKVRNDMNIFLLNYILMLIEAAILIYNPKYKDNSNREDELRRKKKFIILVCCQWILISGLRADLVGNDTINYMRHFDMHSQLSWNTVLSNFYNYYIEGDESLEFEPGFILFEKVLSVFTDNHEVYKFVVAIIFMGSMGRFVYKNSKNPLLSFLLYDGLFYNMFSLTGYRQVISVAIGIFWGYEFVKKRKPIPFFILLLIAATFHKSTLFFAVFYFISQKKLTKIYVIGAIITIMVMIVLRNPLFNLVKGIAGYDQYEGMENVNQTNFLLMFSVLVILCIWRYRYIIPKHPDAKIYYNGLIMSGAMIPLAMASPTSMRLVYDFAFQLMFLLPLVIDSFPKNKDRALIYLAMLTVFGYFIAVKTPAYIFFWQDNMRFYRYL